MTGNIKRAVETKMLLPLTPLKELLSSPAQVRKTVALVCGVTAQFWSHEPHMLQLVTAVVQVPLSQPLKLEATSENSYVPWRLLSLVSVMYPLGRFPHVP